MYVPLQGSVFWPVCTITSSAAALSVCIWSHVNLRLAVPESNRNDVWVFGNEFMHFKEPWAIFFDQTCSTWKLADWPSRIDVITNPISLWVHCFCSYQFDLDVLCLHLSVPLCSCVCSWSLSFCLEVMWVWRHIYSSNWLTLQYSFFNLISTSFMETCCLFCFFTFLDPLKCFTINWMAQKQVLADNPVIFGLQFISTLWAGGVWAWWWKEGLFDSSVICDDTDKGFAKSNVFVPAEK